MLAFSPIRTFSCGGAFLLHLLPATEKYRPLSQAKIITNGDCGARPFVVILQHKNHTVMKRIFLLLALTVNSQWSMVFGNDFTVPDSSKIVDIEEVVVIATPKEQGKLKEQPSSVSIISQQDMLRHHITSVKGISSVVPNLFIPDYGSRLTTAIYIRGIGSRINTPAAGLYVDNIPYYNMSAFDFNLYDIERIDVLRGPQGTLYGRNSMGGLVRVNTRSPFTYQGTDLKLSMATGDWHRRASLTHYHRISDRFAFSAGGYYDGSSGFWHNSTRHERQDKMNSGGGRLRAILKPSTQLKFDLSLGYDYTHEGGYPYFFMGEVAADDGSSDYGNAIGKISSNEKTSYRRGMFNGGLNVEWQGHNFVLNAVTGVQHLNDRMFMDQDFLCDSIYTLEQRQRMTMLTEEITMKYTANRHWSMVNGLSMAKQWLRTKSPVVFKTDGMAMLEQTINGYLDNVHQNTGAPQMGVDFNTTEMPTRCEFQSPLFNVALFHQSTFNITDRFSATVGARFDYEHNSLTYLTEGSANYNFLVMGRLMPQFQNLEVSPTYSGKVRDDHLDVLPKVALKYVIKKKDADSNEGFAYASLCKGHRAGGYNIQMFSDLLQSGMRNEMMSQVGGSRGGSHLDGDDNTDVKGAVSYEPEYSWTYELGAKFKHSVFSFEGSVFLTTVRDQQIARFSENGFGRMMVNAGRSRNWGTELSLGYNPNDRLSTWLNYGFTRATFTKYDDGSGTDYSGKYVPFIPRHTLCLGADYTFPIAKDVNSQSSVLNVQLKSLTLGLNTLGTGRIYWTEANNASQAMYFTFGAHALLNFGSWELNLWGRNLTDKHYHAFYFESMNRAFVQKGKPLQVGVDVNVKF